MITYFPEKKETLSTLKKIAQENSEKYIRDKAKKAIAHLESIQKEQEQQKKQEVVPAPAN